MPNTMGERIRDLRARQGFKQEELAQKIGVSRQVLSNWERGYTPPDVEGLTKLAKILGTSTDFILNGYTGSTLPNGVQQILDALEDDEELLTFFKDLSKRDELQLLFKQVRPLKNESIKRIIKYIKIVEDEESRE